MQNLNDPSVDFTETREEAAKLQALWREVYSEVRSANRSMKLLEKDIKASDLKHDPRVKRIVCELNLLKPYLTQSKGDVAEMRSHITGLVYVLGKAPYCPTTTEEMEEDAVQIDLDNAEAEVDNCDNDNAEAELDNCANDNAGAEVENCDNDNSDTISTERGAFKVIPHTDSIQEKDQCLTVISEGTNQTPQVLIKHEPSADVCDCAACEKKLSYNDSLKRLFNAAAKEGKTCLTCRLCGAVTNNARDHMNRVHPNVDFQCQDCGKIFEDFDNMWRHKKIHQQEEEINKLKEKCRKNIKKAAKQVQNTNADLDTNPSSKPAELNTKTEIVPPCQICGKQLKLKRSLNRHMLQVHSTPGVKHCDVCGKPFKSLYQLDKHRYAVHSTKKYWRCEECGEMFKWKKDVALCTHSNRKVVPKHHKCLFCGAEFSTIARLREHRKTAHEVIQKFPCLICDETFMHSEELRNHLPLHGSQNNELLQCNLCSREFKEVTRLRQHLQRHRNKTHSCQLCGQSGMNIGQLRHHKKLHKQQVSCSVCGRVMNSEASLKEHMNVHTGDKPIDCDVCHMKLPSQSALANHKIRMHNKNNGGNQCYICGKRFRTPFARNSHHYTEHTEEERKQHNVVVKMFTCDICGRTLRLEYKNSHLKQHKSLSERLTVCELCGKGFLRLKQLKMHIIKHHGEEGSSVLTQDEKAILERSLQMEKEIELKHACDICGKKFRFSSTLGYHKKTHTGNWEEKPYKCGICGKGYVSEHTLQLHEGRKCGEEPYRCEVCGKTFKRFLLYQTHLSKHSSLRAFTCPTCGKGFKFYRNMLRHKASVHDGVRKFTCDVCGKSFAAKTVLQTHYRRHTGEKPFTCKRCGRSFSDRSTIYKHNLLHKKRDADSNSLMASDPDLQNVTHYILEGDNQTEILVFS